jgi:cytochrome c peroxidase
MHPDWIGRPAIGARQTAAGFALVAALLWCSGCGPHLTDKPIGIVVTIEPPLGLPPVPYPADNPPTAETIALGRKLFYDPRISQDSSISCASCHNHGHAFSDGLPLSMGVGGKSGLRNAPSILNAAYLPTQFWDGRAASLEQQAAEPISNPLEMNQTHEVLVSRLNGDPVYRAMTVKAFGSAGLDLDRVEKALGSFERTLLSGDSAFDRYEYGGDKSALTASQIRGLAVFRDPNRGNCTACHTIGPAYALFTDGKFHNIGVGVRDDGSFGDTGRFQVTKVAADTGAFATSSLRNVAQTGPYMHDGSQKSLRAVVDFYAGHGNSNPYLDPEIEKISLSSAQDREDLVDFLESLNGTMPQNAGPAPGE